MLQYEEGLLTPIVHSEHGQIAMTFSPVFNAIYKVDIRIECIEYILYF